MRGSLFLGVGVLVTLIGARVRADDASEAREHFKKGAEAYETGEFPRAIEEFKASYARYPSPMLLYNLAQAYRKAGEHELALHEYKQYLAKTVDGTPAGRFRGDAREQAERLEKVIGEQRRSSSSTSTESARTPPAVEKPPILPASPAPSAAVIETTRPVASPVAPARRPIYRQWWLWTTVGVVAVAVGVGLGVGLSQSSTTYPTRNLPQGTFQW